MKWCVNMLQNNQSTFFPQKPEFMLPPIDSFTPKSLYNNFGRADSGVARDMPALSNSSAATTDTALPLSPSLLQIIETLTDLLAVFNEEGFLLWANMAFHDLFLIEHHPRFLALSHEERFALLQVRSVEGQHLLIEQTPLARIFAGESLTGENTLDIFIHSLDGQDHLLNVSGTPIYDEQRCIRWAVLVYRDVTRQRALERQTYDRLNMFLELAHVIALEATKRPDTSQLRQQRESLKQITALQCQLFHTTLASILLLDANVTVMDLLCLGLDEPEEQRLAHQFTGKSLKDTPLLARLQQEETSLFQTSQLPAPLQDLAPGMKQTLLLPLLMGSRLFGIIALHSRTLEDFQVQEDVEVALAVSHVMTLIVERMQRGN
ncbi:hypothetical protein KSD_93120 [Ktedonobacter sp. SOSP1-85]|nr:hypothetical protein KSD_93120 [Ktedonobacter sp. SOSP1-85]